MMKDPSLTRLLLRIFIVSICATALAGVMAIASPISDGWYELKIFLTTATIAAASVCGLACGGCLTRGHTVLPIGGLVFTGVSACLLLLGIWLEVDSDGYWKATLSTSVYAVACAHLSMLFMANLAGSYCWAYMLAYQLILGLATLIAAGTVFEFFDNEAYWRLTGVVSILVAAITLLIPVFHYLSRDLVVAAQADADPLFAVEEEIARVRKRLIELENKRRLLLARSAVAAAEDGPAR